MAKRTLADILKVMFGSKLDEEIDLEIEDDKEDKDMSTVSENEDDNKTDNSENKDNVDTSKTEEKKNEKDEKAGNEEMDNTKIFEDGWYDATSGVVNFDKIKNPEALAAIKTLTDKYNAEKEQRLIDDCLNDTLKEYSLNVSEDTLRKVLDTSGVKIDKDNKVVGIKEAIEALKTSEPGFFKDKEKESNPLNEGFNPVEKPTNVTEDELVELAYCQ